MLRYRKERWDFSPIEAALRQYYPVGVTLPEAEALTTTPVTEALRTLVGTKFSNGYFELEWQPFEERIASALQLPVQDATFGFMPSWSGRVMLLEKQYDELMRAKSLYFFVSMLGPFYAITGRDEVGIQTGDHYRWKTHSLITFPGNEYAAAFVAVQQMIEDKFPGYRPVPHFLWDQQPVGLPDMYANDTVFELLFSHILKQHDDPRRISHGMHPFGEERWLVENPQQYDVWKAYPPSHKF